MFLQKDDCRFEGGSSSVRREEKLAGGGVASYWWWATYRRVKVRSRSIRCGTERLGWIEQ